MCPVDRGAGVGLAKFSVAVCFFWPQSGSGVRVPSHILLSPRSSPMPPRTTFGVRLRLAAQSGSGRASHGTAVFFATYNLPFKVAGLLYGSIRQTERAMPRNILECDQKLSDADIARQLAVHKATICRWRIRGIPLPDGRRLRLPYTRTGRRAYVHPDDLRDFLGQLTASDEQAHRQRDRQQHRTTTSAPQRGRPTRAEQAEREADELGL